LSVDMQERLVSFNEKKTNLFLAQNSSLDTNIAKSFLDSNDEDIKMAIFSNPVTEASILNEAYKNSAYHEALAKNESTPIEILYQLSLDSKYERFVKTNKGFGKHIQSENIGWLV